MNKNWKQKNYDKLLNKVNTEKLDAIKSKGFTNINNEVISMDMPATYKIVYMTLESLCYEDKTECFPTNSTIAYLINKSTRTVQRAISFLKENGLISVTHRIGTSNIFKVLKKVILSKKDKKKFYKESSVNKNGEYGPTKFSNFESREYDYEELEEKLLGWQNKYNE